MPIKAKSSSEITTCQDHAHKHRQSKHAKQVITTHVIMLSCMYVAHGNMLYHTMCVYHVVMYVAHDNMVYHMIHIIHW